MASYASTSRPIQETAASNSIADDANKNDTSAMCTDGSDGDKWWLHIGDYFEYVSGKDDGKNMVFSCKLCQPRSKTICAAKSSNANLKKHVEVIRKMNLAIYVLTSQQLFL